MGCEAHFDKLGDSVDDGRLHFDEAGCVHGAAVGNQDHAQSVAALFLRAQAARPWREEDAVGRLALAHEVYQRKCHL